MVLQSFLAREGALDKAAGWDHHDDGLFGPKTKKALRSFLELHGYDVGKSGGWYSITCSNPFSTRPFIE